MIFVAIAVFLTLLYGLGRAFLFDLEEGDLFFDQLRSRQARWQREHRKSA